VVVAGVERLAQKTLFPVGQVVVVRVIQLKAVERHPTKALLPGQHPMETPVLMPKEVETRRQAAAVEPGPQGQWVQVATAEQAE
jgi:hypothetical protein